MDIASLPRVDEHATTIAGTVDQVWPALLDAVDGAFSRPAAAAYARAVRCADPVASGPRPLAEGATVPGFRVTAAVPGRELVLVGRHRFSSYALRFRLEQLSPGSVRLSAESRATFPGVPGRLYRLLGIGTRAHVVGVRRLLGAVRRRCGRPTG